MPPTVITNGKPQERSPFEGRRVHSYRRRFDQWAWHPALREGRFRWHDARAMVLDNAVSIGLKTLCAPMSGAQFEVRANSPVIKTFVENTIYRFWTHDLLRVLRPHLMYGASAGETMFEKDTETGLWKYAGLDDFDIRDVQPWKRGRHMTKMRVTNGGMGVATYMPPASPDNHDERDPASYNVVEHPKIFWSVREQEFGNLHGRSCLEAAWNPWMEKCGSHGALSIRKLWAFGNAFRGCWVRYPPGYTMTADGRQVDNQDIAREIAENYCTGNAGAIPSLVVEGVEQWEIIDPKQNGEIASMLEYPNELNRAIWQGMGVLDEVITAPETGGSWSGRSGPLLIFLNICDMHVREIITAFDVGPSGYTTRNEQAGGVIRPLVMENFGPDAKYEIRAISLVPKPAEPGAGGTPGSAPGAATGAPPASPMGGQGPGQQGMGGPPQAMGGNPVQLSADQGVELPDEEVAAILRDAMVALSSDDVQLSARCPSGYTDENPLVLQGRKYVGGEFIPGYVKIPAHIKEEIAQEKRGGKPKEKAKDEAPLEKPKATAPPVPDENEGDPSPDAEAAGDAPADEHGKADEQPEVNGDAPDQPEPPDPVTTSTGLLDSVPDPSPDNDPRERAAAAERASDPDYEFARVSSIPNIGADLKGSARHRRNAWRSLADAEANGTAEEMVTRANLLKNEPHELMGKITPANSLASLAAHLAINSFPAAPYDDKSIKSYERTKERSSPKDQEAMQSREGLRKQYFDAYQRIKSEAELAANQEVDPRKVVERINDLTGKIIKEYRGATGEGYMAHVGGKDHYNPVANALIDLQKRTQTQDYFRRKLGANDVLTRTSDFAQRLKSAYGDDPTVSMLEKSAEHVKDVMEGESFNKTFGTVEGGKKGFDPATVYVKVAKRKGGRDVDATTVKAGTDFVMNNLKMRGLQWGNSVTDDERQHHLQKAAEAFADLADVLGLPDHAISLNGTMGLAIGARGRANASAHYEPDTKVINLTRKNGVGSLAHEWGHALDHFIMGGKITSGSGEYMSERVSKERIPTEDHAILAEMVAVRKAMEDSGYNKRLRQGLQQAVGMGMISKDKANDYWNSGLEKFARTFEQYVQHKLRSSNRDNTYLAGKLDLSTEQIEQGGELTVWHGLWPSKDEAEKIAPAIDKLMSAVKARHFATTKLSTAQQQPEREPGEEEDGPRRKSLQTSDEPIPFSTATHDVSAEARDETGEWTAGSAGSKKPEAHDTKPKTQADADRQAAIARNKLDHAKSQSQAAKRSETMESLTAILKDTEATAAKADEIAKNFFLDQSAAEKIRNPMKWAAAKGEQQLAENKKKYGVKGALAIWSAGQVITWGITIGLPMLGIPLVIPPGGGLLTTALLAVVVDKYRKMRGSQETQLSAEESLTPDEIHQLAVEMVTDQLKELHQQFTFAGAPDASQVVEPQAAEPAAPEVKLNGNSHDRRKARRAAERAKGDA